MTISLETRTLICDAFLAEGYDMSFDNENRVFIIDETTKITKEKICEIVKNTGRCAFVSRNVMAMASGGKIENQYLAFTISPYRLPEGSEKCDVCAGNCLGHK